MQASKSLPKPQNWQDFETLCKKLWGEIWECPEIKKNGRQGQTQNGVDISGMPQGETGYIGIQCKGKDEYTGKNFTRKEIEKEIEKAKSFIPKLNKLYFATTAEKDVKIEQYIREVNLKNISDGFFEVHLFCWSEIVDLIFENRKTYDYYVNCMNFTNSYSAKITFGDGNKVLEVAPRFRKDTIIKVSKPYERYNPRGSVLDLLGPSFGYPTEKYNASFCCIQLKLINTGLNDISNFKIFIEFEGEISEISLDNNKIKIKSIISSTYSHIKIDEKCIEVNPSKKLLVGEEEYLFDEFYIKTLPVHTELKLKWKLISSNFREEGTLFIDVNPEIIEKKLTSETEDYGEIGKIIMKDVEDFWEYK